MAWRWTSSPTMHASSSRLMLKKNGYVLEQVFSPLVVHALQPQFDTLRELARRCITRGHAHHYKGFAHNQWKLFEKERPRRIKPFTTGEPPRRRFQVRLLGSKRAEMPEQRQCWSAREAKVRPYGTLRQPPMPSAAIIGRRGVHPRAVR